MFDKTDIKCRDLKCELIDKVETSSLYREAYVKSAGSLLLSVVKEGCKKLTVTAADCSDGIISAALNLSISLAQMGQKVLFINADFANEERLAAVLGGRRAGLYDALGNNAALGECLISYQADLDILTAGANVPNRQSLLVSPEFSKSEESLCAEYDWIIFAAPPVNKFVDAALINRVCDASVLIVDKQRDRVSDVAKAEDALKENFIGIVLENTKPKRFFKRA